MPRKISFINELTDEAAIMAAEYCPMCGAVKGEPNETDRTEHKDSELIRKIAQLFMEDKTTLHVLLYYVSYPLATVQRTCRNRATDRHGGKTDTMSNLKSDTVSHLGSGSWRRSKSG